MPERQTQWVCETQPVCRCTDEDPGGELAGYDCQCVKSGRVCGHCLQPMVRIDCDTSEVLTRYL